MRLADSCDESAGRIHLVNVEAAAVLQRSWVSVSIDCDRRLGGVVRFLSGRSDELRWRARVIADAQSVGVGAFDRPRWLADFAASAVFSLGDWQHQFEIWNQLRFIDGLRSAGPHVVATSLASLDSSVAAEIAERHPEIIGRLDGAPPEMRYRANAVLIAAEIARLEEALAELDSERSGPVAEIVARLEARADEYRRWLDEDRQILLFDRDGRVVEVFGDLGSSDHVAVVIPGMANNIDNFSVGGAGFRANARDLHAAAGDAVATIAWLGYDTPDGVGAATTTAASAGVADLTSFLEGIDPGGNRHVTVVAHSYGSVLTGMAAATGLEADDVVFIGSPGTTLRSAAEARVRQGGRVWVALADNDPIGAGIDPVSGFEWWHMLVPFGPAITIGSSIVSRAELWHGVNPVAEEFCGTRFTTEGSTGHSSYFEGASLENLALIAAGRYDEVALED